MVSTPYFFSVSVAARPANSISPSGSGHTMLSQPLRGITVVASGFFRSLPSLANTLLNDTPTLSVNPVSARTVARMRSASALASPPNRCRLPVTSSQLSSMPKGSTRSVNRSYISLTRREYSRYSSWWGGSSTSPGHFFRACQIVSAVLTPRRLAGSFLARMMPWRDLGSPDTATGTSHSAGLSSSSTDAKKQFRSQCRITRSPTVITSRRQVCPLSSRFSGPPGAGAFRPGRTAPDLRRTAPRSGRGCSPGSSARRYGA